jgi:hypothetical protein
LNSSPAKHQLLSTDLEYFILLNAYFFVRRSLDQLYVVFTAPDGHEIAEYKDDIEAWIDGLRRAPEIARVDAGVIDRSRDFGWLADRQLLVLRGHQLDEALKRLTADGMKDAVVARRELLSMPSADVADLVRQDPAGLFDLLRESLGGAQSRFALGVSADGYVSQDGRSRLIIARPKRPPYDNAFSRALDARLRSLETSAPAAARAEASDDDEPRPPMHVLRLRSMECSSSRTGTCNEWLTWSRQQHCSLCVDRRDMR